MPVTTCECYECVTARQRYGRAPFDVQPDTASFRPYEPIVTDDTSDEYDDYDAGYDDGDDYDDDYADDSMHIRDHSYKPEPVFYGDGPRFMGWELETSMMGDRGANAERIITTADPYVYLKEDGSISNGFEIVSHPMSYGWAMDSFPWEMFDTMKVNGMRPDATTGLHVHVSKEAFKSKAHLYRWMKFFYRNKHHVQSIARRDSEDWCRFTQRPAIRGIVNQLFDYPGQGAYGDVEYIDRYGQRQFFYNERYVAINTQNPHTLEVRIFRSTDSVQEMKAALGFVDASVRYTEEIDSSHILTRDGWEWESFAGWLPTEYAPLIAEIERINN